MSTVELEEKLRDAELTQKTMDAKRYALKQGDVVPGSMQEALQKIKDVEQTLKQILEAEAFQRVSEVLTFAKGHMGTRQELTVFNERVAELTDVFTDVLAMLQGIDKNVLDVLVRLLTDEVAQQRSQRILEKQFVDDLRRFLDNLR